MIPVTVKCRIGIDEQNPEESLRQFINVVGEAEPDVFIVHARKAWLKGLSPRENRDVPPLDYELVRRVKEENPQITFVLNGGIRTLAEAREHLAWADGVMLGRAAYEHPYILAQADAEIFGDDSTVTSPDEAVRLYLPYIERELATGTPLVAMTRHMLGLFTARPGARLFRRHLSENAFRKGAGIEVLLEALSRVAPAVLAA
jgi:tRNA-dihydrouridine synthase A